MTEKLKKETKRHTIVVLADMLELGNESQLEHEAVARAIGTIPDTLYLVGPLTKRFILPIVEKSGKAGSGSAGKPGIIEWFPSIIELNRALSNIPNRSLILFKGSQGNLWLEESIKLLLKNKEDVSRLCRQNAFWKKVKKAAGRWIEV
jgi:UDP-N-acetylmuramyl pentapeptide synthase